MAPVRDAWGSVVASPFESGCGTMGRIYQDHPFECVALGARRTLAGHYPAHRYVRSTV
jgi:hypothetical protein